MEKPSDMGGKSREMVLGKEEGRGQVKGKGKKYVPIFPAKEETLESKLVFRI